MVALSDGGEDATEAREFDLTTNSFVKGGFFLPRSQLSYEWEDADHLLVATDWSRQRPDRIRLSVHRQARHARRAVVRGERDLSRREGRCRLSFPSVPARRRGQHADAVSLRALDFFHTQTFVLTGDTVAQAGDPREGLGLRAGRRQGLRVARRGLDRRRRPPSRPARSLRSTSPRSRPIRPASIPSWSGCRARGIRSKGFRRPRTSCCSTTLSNVSGRDLLGYPAARRWLDTHPDRPARQPVAWLASADDKSDRVFLDRRRLPDAEHAVSGRRGIGRAPEALKHLPAKFDASQRRGRTARGDLHRRHQDPLFRRPPEGHPDGRHARRRCSTPMAVSRSARRRSIRGPSASCGSSAAAPMCSPISAAAANSARRGTRPGSAPSGRSSTTTSPRWRRI